MAGLQIRKKNDPATAQLVVPWSSFIPFFFSLILQYFKRHLLCSRHCFRCYGYIIFNYTDMLLSTDCATSLWIIEWISTPLVNKEKKTRQQQTVDPQNSPL